MAQDTHSVSSLDVEPISKKCNDLDSPAGSSPKPEYLRRLTTATKELKVDLEGGGLPPAWISEYVSNQALWGSELLRELVKGEAAGAFDKLNPSVLNSCEALAFVKTNKGGLGVTMAHGYGFVIKKLKQDQYGNSQWSQPLFFAVSQAGLGLSAGYQRCQSVMALLSVGAVEVFKTGTTSLGSELGLFSTDGALVGMSGGASMGHSQHLGMSVTKERSAFCYSKVDGLFLEISLHGSSISPDKESNTALYGEGYDANKVLSSAGQYMTEMLPLLRTINMLGKSAMSGR